MLADPLAAPHTLLAAGLRVGAYEIIAPLVAVIEPIGQLFGYRPDVPYTGHHDSGFSTP